VPTILSELPVFCFHSHFNGANSNTLVKLCGNLACGLPYNESSLETIIDGLATWIAQRFVTQSECMGLLKSSNAQDKNICPTDNKIGEIDNEL